MTWSWDQPHAVYRIYNQAGRLIYIGTSYAPPGRVKVHRAEKPWRREIASFTEEWYPNRTAALRAEHKAIAAESPDFNVAGTPLGREVSLAYLAGEAKAAVMAEARRKRASEIFASRLHEAL